MYCSVNLFYLFLGSIEHVSNLIDVHSLTERNEQWCKIYRYLMYLTHQLMPWIIVVTSGQKLVFIWYPMSYKEKLGRKAEIFTVFIALLLVGSSLLIFWNTGYKKELSDLERVLYRLNLVKKCGLVLHVISP